MAFVGDFKAFPLWGAAFLIERDVFKEPADHEHKSADNSGYPAMQLRKNHAGRPKM